jgi:hypothetical protein
MGIHAQIALIGNVVRGSYLVNWMGQKRNVIGSQVDSNQRILVISPIAVCLSRIRYLMVFAAEVARERFRRDTYNSNSIKGVSKILKENDIVRSRKQEKTIIPYLIKEIKEEMAVCINLIDTYDYTIPLHDLYLWIVQLDTSPMHIESIKLDDMNKGDEFWK